MSSYTKHFFIIQDHCTGRSVTAFSVQCDSEPCKASFTNLHSVAILRLLKRNLLWFFYAVVCGIWIFPGVISEWNVIYFYGCVCFAPTCLRHFKFGVSNVSRSDFQVPTDNEPCSLKICTHNLCKPTNEPWCCFIYLSFVRIHCAWKNHSLRCYKPQFTEKLPNPDPNPLI